MTASHDIPTAKAALRWQAKERRAAIAPEVRAEAALRLASHAPLLLAVVARRMPLTADISTNIAVANLIVASFMPFAAELDPRPLIRVLQQHGARLALPRIDGPEISFRLHPEGAALRPGAFGIAEPLPDAPAVHPDLILAPLLAFDRSGARIGYGRGYYDRALARLPQACAVGLAFAAQEVAAVPVDSHDHPLEFILTENGLIDCRR